MWECILVGFLLCSDRWGVLSLEMCMASHVFLLVQLTNTSGFDGGIICFFKIHTSALSGISSRNILLWMPGIKTHINIAAWGQQQNTKRSKKEDAKKVQVSASHRFCISNIALVFDTSYICHSCGTPVFVLGFRVRFLFSPFLSYNLEDVPSFPVWSTSSCLFLAHLLTSLSIDLPCQDQALGQTSVICNGVWCLCCGLVCCGVVCRVGLIMTYHLGVAQHPT